MGTAAGMLAEARKCLGMTGRPNKITREYASRHGDEYLRAAWCDMGVTYWARHSDNADAVLPAGDRAYTVSHAQDFKNAGRWHAGTTANVNEAKPGDVVFFDWGATNVIGAIDHVGLVEKVLGGGRLQTIEANTSDGVRRRVRSADVIAGLGRPDYSGSGSSAAGEEDPLIGLKKGDEGQAVKALQELIRAAGQGATLGKTDGEYGPKTAEALRLVRKSVGSEAGPKYGDQVDGWAFAQLHAAVARVQGKLTLKAV
ncbi:CHAP domain-containing protein [Spirillospora sp. CA-128828]|uniref:C40 family peptidase n=1 Tax=Spirillospora sp. CA-128828 TaxID=3240033 RepID=UPI003D943247